MDKKNKKTLILLVVLLLIFVFTLTRALKPVKPKTITINPQNKEGEKNAVVQQSEKDELFSFEEIDTTIKKIQTLVKNIEESEKQVVKIETNKDPFQKPITKKYDVEKVQVSSILIPEVPVAPDFKVSGIIYDKNRPMAIIDDEIKSEKEIKSGYTIEKILPDRVILSYKDKQFTLFVNNGKNFENTNLRISDASNDTGVSVATQNTTGLIDSKRNENRIAMISGNLSEDTSVLKESSIATAQIDSTEQEKIFTIQVASFAENKKDMAINFAKKLISDGYEDVRVEKINGMYTIRIGKSSEKNDLIPLYEQIKQYSETSFLRKALYVRERIIFDNVSMNM